MAENMSKTPRNRHSRNCVCTLKHKREVNALILDKNVFTATQFALTLSISSISQLSFSPYSVFVYAHSFFLSYFVCVCVCCSSFAIRSFDHNVWLVVLFALPSNIVSLAFEHKQREDTEKESEIKMRRVNEEDRKSLWLFVCAMKIVSGV